MIRFISKLLTRWVIGYYWFSPQVPCAHQGCTEPVMQQEQRLAQVRSWGTETALLHFPVCFCSAVPSRAQLPVAHSLGNELHKTPTEKNQTVNCRAWSWLSAQPLCSLPRLLNQKQTRFRHGSREMQAPSRSTERVSTAQHSTRTLQVMRHGQNPVCKGFLQGKQKSLKQFNYIEATS